MDASMEMSLDAQRDRIVAARRITPEDVMALRRAIYPDGVVGAREAEALFAIEAACETRCAEWGLLFREALTDHAVHQAQPAGSVSEMNAAWLMEKVEAIRDPRADTVIALLVNIMASARDVPPTLAAFTLRQVKMTAIYADGVDAEGRPHVAGLVSQADVEMLRRIVWAAGCEGHMAVSREEAEALFDIADMTAGADNHPDWNEFFARAVGNYLIGATGRAVPSREIAMRRAADSDYETGMVRVLTGVLNGLGRLGSPREMLVDLLQTRTLGEAVEESWRVENATRAAAIADGQVLVGEKAAWLVERVNRNGRISAPEEALVAFVAREAARLDPAVAELVTQARQAMAAERAA